MSTHALPSPAERHPGLHYEVDTRLGEYIYSPDTASWTHRRAKPNGERFILLGRGRCPSQAQLQLWERLEPDLDSFTATARNAVERPPECADLFSRNDLNFAEIRFEAEGAVSVLFNLDAIDQAVGLGAMATFVNGSVSRFQWVP